MDVKICEMGLNAAYDEMERQIADYSRFHTMPVRALSLKNILVAYEEARQIDGVKPHVG